MLYRNNSNANLKHTQKKSTSQKIMSEKPPIDDNFDTIKKPLFFILYMWIIMPEKHPLVTISTQLKIWFLLFISTVLKNKILLCQKTTHW